MNISDELLRAYVEGSLQGAERARIEQAILHDARLAQRVAQFRSSRSRSRGSLEGALHEPIPQRLAQTARSAARPASAQIIDLARVRAERKRRNERHRVLQPQRILAIAASVLVGLLGGALAERLLSRGALTDYHDGVLTASGALAAALDDQPSNTSAPGSDVQVGMTFRSKSGNYCRTFSVSEHSLAGLACHEGAGWQVLTLVGAASAPADRSGVHVVAASASPLMMQAVRERIRGEPLDAQAEARARGSAWR